MLPLSQIFQKYCSFVPHCWTTIL